MARELTIEVRAETRDAEAAMKRLDKAFEDVEKNVTEFERSLKKAEATKKQAGTAADQLTASIRNYVSVGAVLGAVKATIDYADQMNDLAARANVSTTAIQKLSSAASQNGTSINAVTNAMAELTRRMQDGNVGTITAIKKLGFEFESFKKLTPDQQFLALAGALGKSNEKLALGNDLYGKLYRELLPALNAQFVEAADNAITLGEEGVKAGASLADALTEAWRVGKVLLGEALTPILGTLDSIIGRSQRVLPIMQQLARTFGQGFAQGGLTVGLYQMIRTGLTPGRVVDNLTQQALATLPPVPGAPGGFTPSPFGAASMSETDIKLAIDDLTDQAKATTAAQKVLTRSSLRAAKALEAEADAAANTAVALFNRAGNFATFLNSGRSSGAGGGFLYTGIDLTNPFLNLPQYPGAMGYGGPNFTRSGPGINWAGAGLAGLGAAMPWLSQLVAGGSQGAQVGGSIGGTVGGILGSSSMFGGMAGMGGFAGVLGAAAPFLGPIVGIVGSLIGKLFGPSEGAILGQQADARIGQTQQQLIQQFGSVEAIAGMGPAGAALAEAWGSKNVAGEQWFNQLVTAFQKQNDLLSEQKTLQAQIADIEAQRAALAESLVPTYAQVVEAANRYGISLEGLGQQVEQLGATTTWTQMLNDIELLSRAGGDMGGILAGMADEISAVVQRSLAFGTTVPANMRPFIEELSRAGLLLNANGEAITDLSTLNWGAAVKTQADLVNDAMAKLDETLRGLTDRLAEIADSLANLLPQAAAQSARGIEAALNGIELPDIRYGPEPEVQMAAGGIVTRPTVALIGESGPEAVIPLSRMSAPVAVTINVAGYLDSQVARSNLASLVAAEIGRELRVRRRA